MSDGNANPIQPSETQQVNQTAKSEVVAGPKSAPEQVKAASNTFSSMSQLKSTDKEMYDAMMEGLARNIIDRMRRQQDHLIKRMKETRKRNA